MSYSPQTWHDFPLTDTPINAARLGVIEAGVQAADAAAAAAAAAVAGKATINDTTPSSSTAYSSTKTDAQVTAAAAVKAPIMATTAVKTANYTVGVNEIVPLDATSGALTATLPNAPADKTRATVKKIDTSTNAVTVACAGSDVFNKTGGSTSVSLALANQSVTIQYDTSRHVWTVVGDDMPLSGLDARYPVLASGHIPIGTAFVGAAVFVVKSGANWQDLTGATITTRPTGAQLMISISTDGTVPSFATAGLDIALTVPS